MKRSQQQSQPSKVELNITSLVNGIRESYRNLLCFRGWTNGEAEATIASFDNNSELFATSESWIPKEDAIGNELITKMKEYELSFGNISRVSHELHTEDKIVVIESRHEIQRRNIAQDMQRRIQSHEAECEEEKEVLGKRFNEREAKLRKEYALKAAKIHNDIAIIEKPIIWEGNTTVPKNDEEKDNDTQEQKQKQEQPKEPVTDENTTSN